MRNDNYKVIITTSGTGSRLGDITKKTNKALIKLNNKPALSYIIDAYPKKIPIVITLGYLAQQIISFIKKYYPDRSIEFVKVDNYQGDGSSLGYSLLQAKKNLHCPFIFHACDTIVTEKIPTPTENWLGGYIADWEKTNLPLEQYRSHKVIKNFVIDVQDKGFKKFDSIHIGLTGIKDYKQFWAILEELYNQNPEDSSLSDVHIIKKMLEQDIKFSWVPYSVWLDTGNFESLKRTQQYLIISK